MAKRGAKPLYEKPKNLEKAIESYFSSLMQPVIVRSKERGDYVLTNPQTGEPYLEQAEPATITGLALALGFSSRQALINYQEKPEFNDTVTRAKARVEEYAERRLFDRDGARGAEFALRCNFKWRDNEAGGIDQDKLNALRDIFRVVGTDAEPGTE